MYGIILLFVSTFLLYSRASTYSPLHKETEPSPQTTLTSGCIPTFEYTCYFQSQDKTSHCECTKQITAKESCPGMTKYCNEDVSKCTCFYETESGCREDWVFACGPTQMPYADWECSCQGRRPSGGRCPGGYGVAAGDWCFRFLYFRSVFVVLLEPVRGDGGRGRGRGGPFGV